MIDVLTQRQIIAGANSGMSAEDISRDLGIGIEAVKVALAVNNTGTAADRDINDDELGAIRKNLASLALNASDEAVQARVGMYLLDRDKPRNTQEKFSGITAINNAIILGQSAYENLMKTYEEAK